MKISCAFVLIGVLLSQYNDAAYGKLFRRCELAHLLLSRYKFDRTFLSNWICLVEAESGMETTSVHTYGPIYKSFGIFQINNKKYCRHGYVGGLCNARCESFLNDDLRDDVPCANLIFERDGFKAWPGWIRKCKGKQLPNLNQCNLFH